MNKRKAVNLTSTVSPQKSGHKPLRETKKELPFPLNLYQSAVGKKWVMAITGLMLVGFVIGHMVGNLKMYLGVLEHDGSAAYDMDIYAEFLRNLLVPILPEGVFLWILRGGLLTAVILHIHSFYSLTRLNIASGRSYESKQDWLASNFASRSMRYSGIIVLAYIIFHILDLTVGATSDEFVHGAVQSNVVNSLSNPVIAGFYIVANILLCVHIFHGIFSVFQSLGVNNPNINRMKRGIATAVSGLILVGNVSFPVAILAGAVEYNECDPKLSVAEQVEENCVNSSGHDSDSDDDSHSESEGY